MARFKADICGNRGPASRLGSAASGMDAHIRGWDVGVRIAARADGDEDEFSVYVTSGSNGRRSDRLVGFIALDNDGVPRFINQS